MFKYKEYFYNSIKTMKRDEKYIVPMLIKWIHPKSIVDFGCGEGLWLAEARAIDEDIRVDGYDGYYVDSERLAIPKDSFHSSDLRERIDTGFHYDLAISTEVAEHIEEEYADVFVDNITSASDRIFFTAALPGQGGTHHVNEKWQSYWIDKFKKRGFYLDLSIRNFFWENENIAPWRRQNIMFFSKKKETIAPFKEIYDVVHPEERMLLVKRERDVFFGQMMHYLMRPEIYIGLDRILAKIISEYDKIAIYPYGMNGKLCEILMIHKYNREPFLIIDNKLCDSDERIIPARKIPEVNEDFVIIETAGNSANHDNIMNGIEGFAGSHAIFSAFV